MNALLLPLRILIVDRDDLAPRVLKATLESEPGVESVQISADIVASFDTLHTDQINAIFIDPFSFDISRAIDFIRQVRTRYPETVFCLVSNRINLDKLPGVSEEWKQKLAHYYRLPKEANPSAIKTIINVVLYDLSRAVISEQAVEQLRQVRELVIEQSASSLDEVNLQLIKSNTEFAARVLSSRAHSRITDPLQFVPGISTDDARKIVDRTLREGQRSLNLNSYTNIGVLLFAALLITGAFVYGISSHDWTAVGFGGVGMAGVIASLITNPLSALGAASRRQVQLQLAYITVLKQIEMMGSETSGFNAVERGEKLGREMRLTLEALHRHFDAN